MRFLAAVLPLAIASRSASVARAQDPPAGLAALERILVLGASVSHGYGLEQDGGEKVRFVDVVEASLCVDHDRVRSRTSLFFFTDPVRTGEAMVDAGRADDPTLVVGIDFLFWFGYGVFATESDRMAMLETGLRQMERFDCPLIVGDLPDLRVASRDPTRGGVGWLLIPEQVPEPETLRKLNERVRQWASGRKKVVVMPLAELVGRMHSRRGIEIHGNRWAGEQSDGLVQRDQLHPTLDGAIALWLGALDAFVTVNPDVPPSVFHWDVRVIRRRIQECKAPAGGVR